MEKKYQSVGNGFLMKNNYKEKENHPDYTGEIEINAVKYKISSWKKNSSTDNKPYLSIAVSNKQEANESVKPDFIANQHKEEIPF